MTYTAFEGHRRLTVGPLADVARVVATTRDRTVLGPVLVFDDTTGAQVDLDLRGSTDEIAQRYQMAPVEERRSSDAEPTDRGAPGSEAAGHESRGPGRPRLGVIPREVTLLPQHWDWLAQQRGGASVTLRRLVEQARRSEAAESGLRAAREAAYRFLYAIGGNLPDYDEVSRALFAGDRPRLERLIADWPPDVATYLVARLDG